MIPYLSALTRMLSTKSLAAALGMEIPTLESLIGGMYKPQEALLQEIKGLYGVINYQNLVNQGMAAYEANYNMYNLPYDLKNMTAETVDMISRISYLENVDPELVAQGLGMSKKSKYELEGMYAEVMVPNDYFEHVSNELLYI